MGDFGNAIKYLYSQFILRDVLSFITPGAIIVFTALFLFYREIFSYSFHWFLYIPLFGVFYILGFAVQCFGEIVGFVRIHVDAKGCCRQRRNIFWCKWDDRSNIWWKKAYEDVVDFNEKMESEIESDKKGWARLQNERLVVLKQMCANSFIAGLIAVTFIIVKYACPEELLGIVSIIVVSLVAFLLLASLFWGYRIHELRLDTMRKAIRHLPFGGKEGS